ncbi:MAG: YaiI/YqxD family protein [Clostridium sp.]
MKILIDADGCPVVDITIRVAKKFSLETIIMCDTAHVFNREGAETIILSKGADSVDFALVNKVNKGDVIVTQDYGLAAMVLAKGGFPINQSGKVYTNENIDDLLLSRHISKQIRNAGGRVKGPKKRKREDDIAFEESLIKLLKLYE